MRLRLESQQWPLYDRTPNRSRIVPGVCVAFYVGGTGPEAGTIVATATVKERRNFRPGSDPIDPKGYLTERPSIVLSLSDLAWLDPPVAFREVLPDLTICPKNLSKWGAVLMGGARAISHGDWNKLFGQRAAG